MSGQHTPAGDRPVRVVLDTDVIVAAFFSPGGASAEVWRRVRDGDLVLLWSSAVREEIFSILHDVKVDSGYRAEVREEFRPECRVVPQPLRIICDDPSDDEFLACAVYGGADALVTNDRHLLDLGSYQGVHILTPADFLSQFRPIRPQRSRGSV